MHFEWNVISLSIDFYLECKYYYNTIVVYYNFLYFINKEVSLLKFIFATIYYNNELLSLVRICMQFRWEKVRAQNK